MNSGLLSSSYHTSKRSAIGPDGETAEKFSIHTKGKREETRRLLTSEAVGVMINMILEGTERVFPKQTL